MNKIKISEAQDLVLYDEKGYTIHNIVAERKVLSTSVVSEDECDEEGEI